MNIGRPDWWGSFSPGKSLYGHTEVYWYIREYTDLFAYDAVWVCEYTVPADRILHLGAVFAWADTFMPIQFWLRAGGVNLCSADFSNNLMFAFNTNTPPIIGPGEEIKIRVINQQATGTDGEFSLYGFEELRS